MVCVLLTSALFILCAWGIPNVHCVCFTNHCIIYIMCMGYSECSWCVFYLPLHYLYYVHGVFLMFMVCVSLNTALFILCAWGIPNVHGCVLLTTALFILCAWGIPNVHGLCFTNHCIIYIMCMGYS